MGIPEDDERNRPNGAVSSEENNDVCSEDDVAASQTPCAGKWRGTIISPDPRPIRREEVHLLCQVMPSFIISMLYQRGTES